MSRRASGTDRLHAAAPWVALAMLVGVFVVGGFRPDRVPGTDAYFAEVAERVEALPYRVGKWIGQDVRVQQAAEELLRPNKLLQRRYVDPATQEAVSVLVVHCGDARDMNGHYPPVCYPSQGWAMSEAAEITVPVNGQPTPAMRYTFSRPDSTAAGLRGEEMVVANLFALPNTAGTAVLNMDAVDRTARSAERAGLGAAQIQVITPASMPDAEREEVQALFFEALSPVIETVRSGVDRAG